MTIGLSGRASKNWAYLSSAYTPQVPRGLSAGNSDYYLRPQEIKNYGVPGGGPVAAISKTSTAPGTTIFDFFLEGFRPRQERYIM